MLFSKKLKVRISLMSLHGILINRNYFLTPINIHGQIVEIVDDFKYLGTYIDEKLAFHENTNFIF